LGSADLSIAELTALQPGDVVRLDASIKQDLSVRVGTKTRFHGRAGIVGKRLAVQIVSINPPAAGPEQYMR
jgi:flagellar motor switch protein FliM